MKRFLLKLGVLILTANLAFADDAKPEMDADKRLQSLEHVIETLKNEIASMKLQQQSPGEVKGGALPATAGGNSYLQTEDLREQIKSLRGDVEQLQFDNAKINEKLVKFSADVEFRFNEMNKTKGNASDNKQENRMLDDIDQSLDNNLIQKESDSKESSKKQDLKDLANNNKPIPDDMAKADSGNKAAKNKGIEDQYQEAYSYIKAKDYKTARDMFQKFVKENPDNDLTGSAYFWLGETYYLRAEYDTAAVQYLKGYQSNIRGSRSPDNLLKLAKSLAKLDKRKESCTTLSKLRKEFPNAGSNIKKQMDEDIKNLRCVD